tara:strand:- start:2225 stop:2719 length:495 start_codon:yes stop_codon:yes gene_type:complete
MPLGLSGSGNITGGTFNRPIAQVNLSSDQTITDNVSTVIAFNQVITDTNSCFNTSTSKFTPDVSGFYFVTVQAALGQAGGTESVEQIELIIFKNTDTISRAIFVPRSGEKIRDANLTCSAIPQMNGTSDFIQFEAKINTGGNVNEVIRGNSTNITNFNIFKLNG